jgi:hypothetical protein
MRWSFIVVLILSACSRPQEPMEPLAMTGGGGAGGGAALAGGTAGGSEIAGGAAGGAAAGGTVDLSELAPKRWPPSANPSTHDVDVDLAAVLEAQSLAGACEAVKNGASDQLTRLRCGKWMFFYETFGTTGVPIPLLDFLQKYYADSYYGRGFSRLGFVPDPASTKGMPLGLAPTTGKAGSVATLAFTCASCHFGKMPDGRYAVGYGNLSLDYGKLLASMGAPLSLSINANDTNVHSRLKLELATPIATAKAQPLYQADLGLAGLQLLGAGSGGQLSVDEQGRFLTLRPGTMDFLTKPLVDDGVWTVSRILSLWNVPDGPQRTRAGMPHEMLSWNGGVDSVESFLKGFVTIGVGRTDWNDARLAPLAEYVRTLRAPASLETLNAAEVKEGARLFVGMGCLECHKGPSGEGARVFTFDELGTDATYAKIYNPGSDGKPCCGLGGDTSNVTRGVKAPRMGGLFSQSRFLHNGSVATLEELFCLSPRDPSRAEGQRSDGHGMTCQGLTEIEKRRLITYLKSL